MNIECILKRDGGTTTDIGGIQYHFEPLADGAHVANVEREDHIDRFLAIPEGYKVYHGKLAPKGKAAQIGEVKPAPAAPARTVAKPAGPLAGSELLPPEFEIGGRVVTQLAAAQAAFAASGMTSDEWNELGDEERAAKIEIALDDMAEAAESQPAQAEMTREELVAAYKAKFGKAPHHKKSVEAIKAELAAE